jgi:hypothetical protein
MGRSGYTEDYGYDDQWQLIRWRGAVASALRGKRGQAFLRECLAALDAMPDKKLYSGRLVGDDGACCTMGAVVKARGLEVPAVLRECEQEAEDLDYSMGEVADRAAELLDIASAMAREIAYENDEVCWKSPSHRWKHMRAWVAARIEEPTP